jgi:TolB protein
VDVSGDGKRVLVANLYRYEQISLVTGKVVNSFKLPSSDMPVTYTRPSGLNLLLSVNGTVRRYDLNGKLAKVLSRNSDAAIESPDGTSVIVAARHGIDQVSNLGGVIKRLNGPASVLGCQPVRWWNAATVLVWCGAKHGPDAPRLWLFPLGGGRVSALTAQRNGRGPDFGDIDAWTLTSGVYLQALGACGSEFIATQSRNGSAHHVVIPGVNYASDRIITGFRSSLLVEADNGCSPGASLVWFNPHTKKVTWVIRGLKQGGGLDSVVSFGRPVS